MRSPAKKQGARFTDDSNKESMLFSIDADYGTLARSLSSPRSWKLVQCLGFLYVALHTSAPETPKPSIRKQTKLKPHTTPLVLWQTWGITSIADAWISRQDPVRTMRKGPVNHNTQFTVPASYLEGRK